MLQKLAFDLFGLALGTLIVVGYAWFIWVSCQKHPKPDRKTYRRRTR